MSKKASKHKALKKYFTSSVHQPRSTVPQADAEGRLSRFPRAANPAGDCVQRGSGVDYRSGRRSIMEMLDERLEGLSRLIGNTPLLGIGLTFRGKRRVIYAKCEQLNLTGSIKDRMALHILKRAYADGSLRPGQRIAEATSGNTGIAFAALGHALGHPVTIFMPDWMSQERRRLIRSYGADIVLVGAEQGGFLGSIRMAEELASADPRACFFLASSLIRPTSRPMKPQRVRKSGRSCRRPD